MEKLLTTDEALGDMLTDFPAITGHLKKALIAFAAMHVALALKAASEKATTNGTHRFNEGHLVGGGVNKESILTAYPLDNIK